LLVVVVVVVDGGGGPTERALAARVSERMKLCVEKKRKKSEFRYRKIFAASFIQGLHTHRNDHFIDKTVQICQLYMIVHINVMKMDALQKCVS